MKEKHALVISAYPCCGKSYMYNNPPEGLKILDSDYFQFSCIIRKPTQEEIDKYREELKAKTQKGKRLMGEQLYINNYTNTDIMVRNPEFPANYIKHIKDNLDKVDIIFVSSHLKVREAMTEAGIEFVTVYPDNSMLNEWVGRMYRRGNDKAFIDFQIDYWDEFTNNIQKEPHGKFLFRLNHKIAYIEDLYNQILEPLKLGIQ